VSFCIKENIDLDHPSSTCNHVNLIDINIAKIAAITGKAEATLFQSYFYKTLKMINKSLCLHEFDQPLQAG
jgi:hypothetical protein